MIQYDGLFTGGRPNGGKSENCAIQYSSTFWVDWYCEDKEGETFCVCNNQQKPLLKLRGLCQYSKLDSLYIPWNTRQDIRKLEYVGPYGTTIYFEENQKRWSLQVSNMSELNTQGVSALPFVSFALGKHQWEIENDTFECDKGGS